MITRRSALAMLPAGLMASSSFMGLARAQPLQPTFRPNPQAAREILTRVDQAGRTAHHEATKALIQSYIRVAGLRNAAADSRSRLNSKDDLRSALEQHDSMHWAVKVALDSRKKTDEIIDKEKDPHGRRISESEKIKLGSVVDIKNNELKQALAELLAGSGDFDLKKAQQQKIARLNLLAEDLLRAGRDLSSWGPDAFYAMARGYAMFQFVRYCLRTGSGGTRTTSSLILARAHTLKVIADSESYCAHRAASLAAPPPTLPTPPPATGSTPGEVTWTERHDVEKMLIDRYFPKEVYLGSQIGRETRCDEPGRRIRNFYGTFTNTSSFDRGFKMEGVSVSDCEATINARRREALNNVLSDRLKFPGPASGNAEQFREIMRSAEESLNAHIRFLKRQKEKENPPNEKPSQQPPAGADDVSREFTIMQQMAAALREALALT